VVYQRKPDGTLEAMPAQPVTPMSFLSGGGGLYSTAADYLKFSRALMAGSESKGKRILTAESVVAMRKNQIGGLQMAPLHSLMPQLLTDNSVVPGGIDKFGLGFALNSLPGPRGRDAYSMAWAGIYSTYFWIDPEKKVCAVLMSQMLPFLDPGSATVLPDFEKAVYDSLNK
jgi:CubicO group peptidase (beta-lactamase class C family)